MGLFDELVRKLGDVVLFAQSYTRVMVAEQVRERAWNSALSAFVQLSVIGLLVWWGVSSEWSWWSRFASTLGFALILAWNVIRTVFFTIPDLRKWMSGWRKMWLDLCGVSLVSELLVRNLGAVVVIVLLIASRTVLGWSIPFLTPW